MTKKYVILKDFLKDTIAVTNALGYHVSKYGEYADVQNTAEPRVHHFWVRSEGDRVEEEEGSMCLMGAVELVGGEGRYGRSLGLTPEDLGILEAGFCGWPRPSRQRRQALYRLGAQLARGLKQRGR